MVVVGVGQENRADWFVDFFDSLADSFPMATWVNHNQVFVPFQIISVFIGNGIHGFMDFQTGSNLKECTKLSIA